MEMVSTISLQWKWNRAPPWKLTSTTSVMMHSVIITIYEDDMKDCKGRERTGCPSNGAKAVINSWPNMAVVWAENESPCLQIQTTRQSLLAGPILHRA
ncbi:hypothetical protein SLA2020_347620 [Shorea laevis]